MAGSPSSRYPLLSANVYHSPSGLTLGTLVAQSGTVSNTLGCARTVGCVSGQPEHYVSVELSPAQQASAKGLDHGDQVWFLQPKYVDGKSTRFHYEMRSSSQQQKIHRFDEGMRKAYLGHP
jgi:hypothetical protein